MVRGALHAAHCACLLALPQSLRMSIATGQAFLGCRGQAAHRQVVTFPWLTDQLAISSNLVRSGAARSTPRSDRTRPATTISEQTAAPTKVARAPSQPPTRPPIPRARTEPARWTPLIV